MGKQVKYLRAFLKSKKLSTSPNFWKCDKMYTIYRTKEEFSVFDKPFVCSISHILRLHLFVLLVEKKTIKKSLLI